MTKASNSYKYFVLKTFLLIVFLLSISFSTNAQNKKEKLQNQYNKIQKELKEIESLIKENKQERSNYLEQLGNIKTKISSRQSLITNINEQIKLLNEKIAEKETVISSLKKDIEQLKKDYALMIQNAYSNKYKSSSYLSFLLNAESFNQAIQRLTYLQSYARTRSNQSKLIESTIADLNLKIETLKQDKASKQALLGEEETQKKQLVNEQDEKNSLISKLKSDESKLQQQAKDKNKAAQDLNNQIQKIIAEEIRLAKEKAAKEAKTKGGNVSTNSSGMALTPEEKLISTDFVNNRGKLPWPVSKGFIISKFGKQAHPTLHEVYTNNNGVDIKTEKDATVRALFNGTVINSFYLPATQNSVIVKHGEYFTVYSNLKTVNVKAGENIITKQEIGKVYTEEGVSKVHLEIWKGTEKTNPELWLAK